MEIVPSEKYSLIREQIEEFQDEYPKSWQAISAKATALQEQLCQMAEEVPEVELKPGHRYGLLTFHMGTSVYSRRTDKWLWFHGDIVIEMWIWTGMSENWEGVFYCQGTGSTSISSNPAGHRNALIEIP